MIPEEYRVLKFKYMKQGLSSSEDHEKIRIFIKIERGIIQKYRFKNKSEAELKIKLEENFQKEFAKLS